MFIYLSLHVNICEDDVEIIVGHSIRFPQFRDEILVLQILLSQTFHGFVILCKDATQNPTIWSTNQKDKCRRLQIARQSAGFVLTGVQRDMCVFHTVCTAIYPVRSTVQFRTQSSPLYEDLSDVLLCLNRKSQDMQSLMKYSSVCLFWEHGFLCFK